MDNLFSVRERYGGVFTTTFQDGLIIPWKPLSIGDYIKYTRDFERGVIPRASLEDEVFSKYVLDSAPIKQLPFLKAGIITTVFQNIWEYSGPVTVEDFNKNLNDARDIIFNGPLKALHELVQTITMAFPYKPEEIYAMDYETFLLRTVQAEKKLLDLGIIKEPLTMSREGPPEEVVPPAKKVTQEKLKKVKERIDAKKLWEEQEAAKTSKKPQAKTKMDTPASPGEKWYETSPVLEAEPKHGINFGLEGKEQELFGSTGHEKIDAVIEKNKMIKDAQFIYKDVLQKLAEKKKVG